MGKKKGQPSSKNNMGGALIASTQRRRMQHSTASKVGLHTTEFGGNKSTAMEGSVLERNDLEEFMKLAEESHREFETQRYAQLVDVDSHVLVREEAAEHEKPQIDIDVRIPRRPFWTPGISAEKLADMEMDNFLSWRKTLADYEEQQGYILTPFEKNLDFWRQLWRTVERSDVIFQILDARDPLFYYCEDLTKYVEEVAKAQGRKKSSVVLMNKSDFVPKEIRDGWKKYFEEEHAGVRLEFFSALQELSKVMKVAEEDSTEELVSADSKAALGKGINDDDSDVLTVEGLMELLKKYAAEYDDKVTIGMVGFPNVGKSTVINALWGAKKVSMSRQPGKTKHLQTLELVTEDFGGGNKIQLCDCPGLVFPTAVRSKADLVISGTVPIDYLRDYRPSIDLIVEKVGLDELLEQYKCAEYCTLNYRKLGRARALLSAYALRYKKFLKLGVPDEYAAARVVLRDYCVGNTPHFEYPPNLLLSTAPSTVGATIDDNSSVVAPVVGSSDDADEEDKVMAEDEMALELKDLHEFLQSRGNVDENVNDIDEKNEEMREKKKPTKRALRMSMKKAGKNKQQSEGKLYDDYAGRVSASLATKINPSAVVHNPGSQGRVSRRLQDPYGCQDDRRA